MADDQDLAFDQDEVSAAEAARLTGLSERTIRRKIAANALPARRIAVNRYAIRRQDLSILASLPTDPPDADLPDADLANVVAGLEGLVAQVEQVAQHLPPLLPQSALDTAPGPSLHHGEE